MGPDLSRAPRDHGVPLQNPEEHRLQPLLHDLVSCVRAPALALSDPDGQVRPVGAQGWFRADRRLLSELTVGVNGREPEGLHGSPRGASSASFTAVARHLGDVSTDPSVLLARTRELADRRLTETVTVTSSSQSDVDVELSVTAACDLAPMATVRSGGSTAPVHASEHDGGLVWRCADDDPRALSVSLHTDPAPDTVDAAAGRLAWRTRLGTGDTLSVRLTAEVAGPDGDFGAPLRVPWSTPDVVGADPRVGWLARQSLDDLTDLLLRDDAAPEDDHFLAAGTPWFLTLFGRDSLWAARMLLPLGSELALSTLRTLARRQGTRRHAESGEQPGKILHEVRSEALVLGSMSLPPVYFGTVDATPLFVVLLADAWRWGAPTEQVEELLPAAERCLRWVERESADGLLRYVDNSGHGLANQGWKDSVDAVQWADGRLAEPPIALCEVQGYAYQAALTGADLLDAFGRPGSGRWRELADRLRDRFRQSFWVCDDAGPYPAVALDGEGRPVDSVASNMGHLLGTGLLEERESAAVAARLAGDDMDSGFGLRTLTSRSPRYAPLSYHGGSVWPHDTAIAVHGLCRESHVRAAVSLFRGLLAAAPAFGYRLPELHSGASAAQARTPVPYPSACRPQAWAAAAPLSALVALLGLHVDVPAGVLGVPARVDPDLGPLAVRGLDVGGYRLDVEVAADGTVAATSHHPYLDVRTTP